jgi:hypothetical protein
MLRNSGRKTLLAAKAEQGEKCVLMSSGQNRALKKQHESNLCTKSYYNPEETGLYSATVEMSWDETAAKSRKTSEFANRE